MVIGGAGIPGGGCRLWQPAQPGEKSLLASRQLTRQAIAALEQHQWDEGLRLAREAVQTCPPDVDARLVYGEALWAKGLREEAIRELEEVAQLTGEDAGVEARLGEMYLAVGQIDRAREHANRAIELAPQDPRGWVVRARIARRSGDFPAALADYQRAVAYVPHQPEWLLEVAELYRAMGQPERALATLHQLADTYSPGEEPPQLIYLQGVTYLALNRPQEAAELLAQAIQQAGPCADWLYQLARAQAAAGRVRSAEQTLRQALRLEPQHHASRQLLAQLHSQLPEERVWAR